MIVGQDIPASDSSAVPLVRKDVPLTDDLIGKMRNHNIKFAYIDEIATRKREMMREAAARQPYVPRPKPVVTPKLRKSAITSLQDLFTNVHIGLGDIHASSQIVRQLDQVVSNLVDALLEDQRTIVNINDLKSYDEYTYHHSLSVAVLSIAIGNYFHFDRQELNRLGMCAIMHDIGKTAVPVEIINKTSRLDDEEFTLVKSHSLEGYQYLLKTTIGDERIQRGVLAHHEKIDGTGYPYGAKGEEIPIWGRIISVADVYDALTSNRPYRNPMQPFEALEYIMGGIDTSFDYDVVSAFIKKLEPYPIGSYLELSNGKTGIVLNTENPIRPIVRLLDSGKVIDLYREREYLSVVVSRLLPDPTIVAPVAAT